MASLKYLFYLCLIIVATTQANPAPEVAQESTIEISEKKLDVALGGSASVTCTPGGSKLPVVQWKKYGGKFGQGTKKIGNTLIISNAQKSDTGYYVCAGVVDRKVVQQEYVLVDVKEDKRTQRVKVVQQYLKIKRGQNGTIDCIPVGNPLPTVQWRKAQGTLSDNARQEGNTLVITNAELSDAGDYVCHAIVESTDVWDVYARLEVEDVRPTTEQPAVNKAPIASTVHVTVKHLKISMGQSGRVDCIPEGSPLPRIQWSKETGQFNSRVRPNGNTLVIYDAHDGDGGNYVCHGLVDSTVVWTDYVQVEILPSRKLIPYRPDQLPKPLDVSVSEGQDATISCDFKTGDDQQKVTWTRLNQPLLPQNARQNGRELTIYRATKENAGEYLCQVTGANTLLRQLFVRLSVSERAARPRVAISPDSPTVVRGQPLTLHCAVEGDDVQVAWYRVDGSISSRVENRGAQLIFRSIETDDAGSYRCIARNRGGETVQTTKIIVTDAPPVQGDSRVTVNVRRMLIPRGESRTVDCTPEGSPLPRVLWAKNEGQFSSGVRQVGNSLSITNAQDGDAGDYVCNGLVESTPIWTDYLQIIIQDVPEPSPSPLTASVTLKERQVRIPRGGSKTVECIPGGSPLPTVQWTKEEGDFGPGVRREGNNLIITNAQDSDTGNYMCSGIVQNTAVYPAYLQVIVEDVPSQPSASPTVALSETRVRIPRGGSKTVQCNPGGSPLPTVQWTKEEGNFGPGVRREGNNLIITNAQDSDTGNYICSAIVQNTAVYPAYLQVIVEDVLIEPLVPPMVTLSETRVRIPRGESTTVECIPRGSPLPTVQWTKEEGNFGPGVIREGNNLIITNAQDSDTGNYMCSGIVQNTAVYPAYLQVIVEDVEPSHDERRPSNQIAVRTAVKVSESQVTLTTGESRTIDCIPEGSPLPAVHWTKENGEFGTGTRQVGNALVISNAQEEDRGHYTCQGLDRDAVYTDRLTVEVEANNNNIDKSICMLPLETSWCLGNRWYYEPSTHKCKSFTWGGCGGNANNFETEEACSLACDGV